MNPIRNGLRRRIPDLAPRGRLAAVQNGLPRYRTIRIERFLLIAMVVILPLQGYFPSVAGFSVPFLMFIIAGGYILPRRPGILARISFDPLFVTAYILLILGSLIESLHPHASYSEIFRTAQMIAGAIIVASLCRDRSALRAAMLGYLITGVWLSVYLWLTSFNVLSMATATDFGAASQVRAEVFKGSPVQANWAPVFSAIGGAVALASTLTARTTHRRFLFLGIAVFCALATFLPLSRSGIVVIMVAFAAVMFARGIWRGRTILIAGMIAAAVLMWVPDIVWSRFTFSMEPRQGHMEARARIYTAAMAHFPEYAMIGVGAGNFWGSWGMSSNYNLGYRSVSGAHNVFIQVTIYWGLAGLAALIALVWQAYRCLPRYCGSDVLSLQLLGVSVAVFMMSLTVHNLYAKDFSLVLGLLVGARRWIWPRGIVLPTIQKYRRLRPSLRHIPTVP